MELALLFETVKGAVELAASARLAERDRSDARKVARLRSIIEALRQIYFSPKGVIALLSDLAEGRRPTEAQVSAVLPEFNDFEFRMHHFVSRLDPEDGHPDSALTLRGERVLREISYGKSGIRRKVQELLNEALTTGKSIPRASAAKLREEILVLNRAIEEAEEALVVALRNS